MLNIIIQIDAETRDTYRFNQFAFRLVFVSYTRETKTAKQRVWRISKTWDQYYKSNHHAIPQPYLSPEIRDMAKQEFMKNLIIQTWTEYKGTNG